MHKTYPLVHIIINHDQVDFEEVFSSLVTMQHTERVPKSTSWWWDAHIRPKNSKWLADNLEGNVFLFVEQSYLFLL
jgi:hypothetical protein